MQPEVRALLDAAASPYLAAGRYPYYFARGKLGRDPVFLTLLRAGVISEGARVLDLGCGQGLLAALLIAARRQFDAGCWPAGWSAPPAALRLHGIEAHAPTAGAARSVLGDKASIQNADLRTATLPDADVVVLLDVLHYLEQEDQFRLLQKTGHALRGGGTLLLRVANPEAGWRFFLTCTADRAGALLSGHCRIRHHHRPLGEWVALLAGMGFQIRHEPMNDGTPFANILLVAKRSRSFTTPA